MVYYFKHVFQCISIDSHSIIDAELGSDSLKEHLANIVKLDAPPVIPDGMNPLPEAPSEALSEAPVPSENSDLKSDASGYYGAYRPPPYYGYGAYYSGYYPYGQGYGQPSYPYYSSYPYGYRNNYYSGICNSCLFVKFRTYLSLSIDSTA